MVCVFRVNCYTYVRVHVDTAVLISVATKHILNFVHKLQVGNGNELK